MGDLPLVLACWDYDRTRALIDGRVRPEGIDLTYLPVGIPESFVRMERGEFDASEMSLATLVRAVGAQDPPFLGIPVFPSRMFRHSSVYVHAGSGIQEPKDLVGARVGCVNYDMTAAVWMRGILEEHYAVPVASVTHLLGGLNEPASPEIPTGLPDEIRVERIPDGRTLSGMLDDGEIDALYAAAVPEAFRRGSPHVRRLFPDHPAVEREFFARTRIFPIMHTVVIRRDIHDRHPWVAESLTTAFERAKEHAYGELADMTAPKCTLPWLPSHVEEARRAMGVDFWPYRLERNRETLTAFLGYAHAQGLSSRRLEPDELFAPQVLHAAA